VGDNVLPTEPILAAPFPLFSFLTSAGRESLQFNAFDYKSETHADADEPEYTSKTASLDLYSIYRAAVYIGASSGQILANQKQLSATQYPTRSTNRMPMPLKADERTRVDDQTPKEKYGKS
jgi:hypothetical protein